MLAAPFINYSCVSFRCHKNGEREREGREREREREREKFILLVFILLVMYEGLKLARPTNVSREIVIHH